MDNKAEYFEAEGKHEPIISEEVFNKVQNKIGRMKGKTMTKRPKEDNYFSGTIHCGLCEAKLITHGEYKVNKKGETIVNGNYTCPNRIIGMCSAATFSHRKAEAAFVEYMNDIDDMTAPDDTEERSEQDSINAMLREEYETAIAKLEKKEKDIMALYINDQLTFPEYTQMIRIVTNEKNAYLDQLNAMPTEPNEDVLLVVTDIITNFRENWQLLTNAEKLQFLQNYIEKITAVAEKDGHHNIVKILKVDFYNH